MCEYNKVEYACGHSRYMVQNWCIRYQESQKRCPVNVSAVQFRMGEECGGCRDTSSKQWALRKKASTVHQQGRKSAGVGSK